MIFETITKFRFDINRLRSYFLENVATIPPTMPTDAFGGWSIQSWTGSIQDGWQKSYEHIYINPVTGEIVDEGLTAEKRKELGHGKMSECKTWTPLYRDYLKEMIDEMISHGLVLRRMRFTVLKAGRVTNWHLDGDPKDFVCRIHIPIITNEMCRFETNDGDQHLAADGCASVVRVDRRHRIVNHSTEDRVHIIANVWDTKGVTEHHRYPHDSYPR